MNDKEPKKMFEYKETPVPEDTLAQLAENLQDLVPAVHDINDNLVKITEAIHRLTCVIEYCSDR